MPTKEKSGDITVNCPSCKAKLTVAANSKIVICDYCGTKFSLNENSQSDISNSETTVKQNKSHKIFQFLKSHHKFTLVFVLILIGFIAIGEAGISQAISNANHEKNNAANQNTIGQTSESVADIAVGYNDSDLKGKKYQDVIAKFNKEGFTNVHANPSAELLSNQSEKVDKVISVSIGENVTFKKETKFSSDSEIIVKYYAYKNVSAPTSDYDIKDKNYEVVMRQFKDAGFTNVTAVPIKDLILGLVTKDGQVEQVSINGNTSFNQGDSFIADVKVTIDYHTFPDADSDDSSVKSESIVSNPSADSSIKTESKNEEVKADSKENSAMESTNNVSADNAIITAENNPEFASILSSKDPGGSAVEEFVKKNMGRTVEFDGCITSFSPYENTNTRFNILINAGNYDENTAYGPNFRFENVNVLELHCTNESPDGNIGLGDNIHVVLTLVDYNPNTELLASEPVSVTFR